MDTYKKSSHSVSPFDRINYMIKTIELLNFDSKNLGAHH